jgi:hypothetical protein
MSQPPTENERLARNPGAASFAGISLAGWLGVALLCLLGTAIRFVGFASAGLIELAIIICGALAIKNRNVILGVAEIVLALYLRFEFGSYRAAY